MPASASMETSSGHSSDAWAVWEGTARARRRARLKAAFPAFLFRFPERLIQARQIKNSASTKKLKVKAIRAAVSAKNGSGTILIRRSVAGSRIHRSLSKKILWKIIKYFVKSVDIRRASPAVKTIKMPVPVQMALGRIRFTSAFTRNISARQRNAAAMQAVLRCGAPINRFLTSSIWAISRSLKKGRVCPSTGTEMFRSSRPSPLRYIIISSVT